MLDSRMFDEDDSYYGKVKWRKLYGYSLVNYFSSFHLPIYKLNNAKGGTTYSCIVYLFKFGQRSRI